MTIPLSLDNHHHNDDDQDDDGEDGGDYDDDEDDEDDHYGEEVVVGNFKKLMLHIYVDVTYLFQPKTIKYTSCNANDYYSNLINSELLTRWTGYSCGLNKCSFSYHTRIQSCKVELFYYSYSLSKLMPFVDDIYN